MTNQESATLPDNVAGERLDRVLSLLAGVSRAQSVEWIRSGSVTLDGVVVRTKSVAVEGGATLRYPTYVVEDLRPVAQAGIALTVVHEDPWIVVIDKAAGVVVHPGHGRPDGTLVNGLLDRYPDLEGVGDPLRPGIVHRLDRGTSGLLVVARTPDASVELSAQLKAHSMERVYRAAVWGHPDADAGLIDAGLRRGRRDPTKIVVASDGREARTHYDVLERWTGPPELSEINCRLETGRTHQIRVHLAAIGHPVVADPRYGGRRDSLGLTRPFLHASLLGFRHPGSGETVRFESALPADLAGWRDRWRTS